MTLRASREIASLREPLAFHAIHSALARASRDTFRVVEFSVQADHVHLIAEARDRSALSSGLRGLATRLALAVNRAVGRRGRVWSDRYHARGLTTPRAVRAALVYVLANVRKHLRVASGLDPCSSAPSFDGFADRPADVPRIGTSLPLARTWLLRVGWRGHGLLSVCERPASRKRRCI